MTIVVLIGACAFGAVALAASALHLGMTESRDVRRTLGLERARPQLAGSFVARIVVPAISRAGRLVQASRLLSRLHRDLELAGSPAGWDAERLLGCKLLAAATLPVFVVAVTRLLGAPVVRSTVLAALLGGAGFYVPDIAFTSRIRARQEEIRLGLPDALDLLSLTVEAGLAFDGALDRVGRQTGGALGEELQRVVREMQLGRSRADALRGLADRTTVEEVRSFVLAMVQADAFGIAVGKVLEVQAREMRLKRRQRAEERAQKVPVKIVFPLLFCIFPSLFVVLLGPSAITIWTTMFKV